MNRLIFDMLDRQEQAEQAAYQSEERLRDMIREDFADSERLLRLFQPCGGMVRFFQSPGLPALTRKMALPVRTGRSFAVHKHTLCQIPYFHTHDFYELIYVLRGSCTQELEYLPTPLVLRERQACLLRPGVVHAMSRCGESDMILKFTIPAALFARTAGRVVADGPEMGIRVFQAYTAQTDFLLYMLLMEAFQQNAFGDTAIENYLSLLFVELARGREYQPSTLLFQLSEYFNAHPRSASLGGFASFIGYSEQYASRLVRLRTGRSFLDVMVSLKMERAKRLLSESGAAIVDIAEELGYANASGFHKQFYAACGMTPGAYRKLFRSENGTLRK